MTFPTSKTISVRVVYGSSNSRSFLTVHARVARNARVHNRMLCNNNVYVESIETDLAIFSTPSEVNRVCK